MGEILRHNTENQTIHIGPFVWDSDGKTIRDDLVFTASEIQISKNGKPFAATQSQSNPLAVHDKNGFYLFTPASGDLSDTGTIKISVEKLGALPHWQEHIVWPALMHDVIFSSANLGRIFQDVATISDGVYKLVGVSTGSGSKLQVITVRNSFQQPVSQAKVWVTTDKEGDNLIAGIRFTDDFGQVIFYLDPGYYYVWRDHPNHVFKNPQRIQVITGD